jgi:glycosyltransferase involved in cell wall biosynthesis
MRIYYGAYWFLPASVGFINHLAQRHSLFLVTTQGAALEVGTQWREVIDPAVQVRCETRIKLKNPLYWWHRAVGVWQGISRFRCDLIHLQEVPDPFLLWMLVRVRRVPIVLTVHDPTPHLGEVGFLKYYHQRRAFIEAMRRRADHLITHGEDTRRQLLEACPDLAPERISVIPHGPLDFYRRWVPAGTAEQPGTVLFFGRINAYKGLGVLLEAWQRVTSWCPHAKLVIAGTGYDLAQHRERILGDPQCELIERFIPSEEVASLFARASVVVLPYVEATQSGVLAIALAFGKPAVVTSVGSLPEMVEDGVSGVVVPPKDADALASALTQLLVDDAWRRRIAEGIEQLLQSRFSWQHLAQMAEQVFLRAAEARRTR